MTLYIRKLRDKNLNSFHFVELSKALILYKLYCVGFDTDGHIKSFEQWARTEEN